MEIEEVSEVWANILSSIFGLGFGVPLLLGEGIGSITGKLLSGSSMVQS